MNCRRAKTRPRWERGTRINQRARLADYAKLQIIFVRCEPWSDPRIIAEGSASCALDSGTQPEFVGLELQSAEFVGSAGLIVVTRQRVYREGIAIKMIFQVKDAGETGTGEIGLAPGAVFVLIAN